MGINARACGEWKSVLVKQANKLAKEEAEAKAAKEAKRKPKNSDEN